MKRKKKLVKNLIILSIVCVFITSVFVLGILKNNKIFSEGISFYEPPVKVDLMIDIEEIKRKMDTMTLEEIEETIFDIEKEIERLESKLN